MRCLASLAAAGSLAALLAAVSRVLPAQDLAGTIHAAEALGVRTGVAIADGAGKLLFSHRKNEVFAPASNMKLLTAAAVVSGLGADHAFVTRFLLRRGRLVVQASGDPNWITGTAHSPDAVFGELAAALQRLSATTLSGIDFEPGSFQGPGRPTTWPQDQLHTYYCAPTGPFVLDQGTFSLTITAGQGARAEAAITGPLVALPVRGTIEVTAAAKGAVYGATDLGDAVQVRGKFYRKSPPVTIRTAVNDPAAWYGAALRHALLGAGIRVDPAATVQTADGVVLEYKTPLSAAILRMLEDSSNFDAEQCLRVLGHRANNDGSLAGGVAAIRKWLADCTTELPADAAVLDGSGLSRDNRLSPALLLCAMQAGSRGASGRILRDSLPIAGQSGTLEGRFLKSGLVGRVRAKTGWIRGASALSGFVERRDGAVRWFAILMNYDPRKDGLNKQLKQLQEQVVAAVELLEAPK